MRRKMREMLEAIERDDLEGWREKYLARGRPRIDISYEELRSLITDDDVVEMMEIFGGSFVKALAEAYRRADMINKAKIRDTWPEYWKQYEEMARDKMRQAYQSRDGEGDAPDRDQT